MAGFLFFFQVDHADQKMGPFLDMKNSHRQEVPHCSAANAWQQSAKAGPLREPVANPCELPVQ